MNAHNSTAINLVCGLCYTRAPQKFYSCSHQYLAICILVSYHDGCSLSCSAAAAAASTTTLPVAIFKKT